MSPEEAVKYGLIDAVVDIDEYQNVKMVISNQYFDLMGREVSNNHLKKPVRCTKENGDVVIFNGSREIVKAGYDDSIIHKLAKGGKQTRKDRPNGKGYTIRKKHKDIIKVEFI